MTDTTTPAPHPPRSSIPPIHQNEMTKIFESKVFWLVLIVVLFSIPLVLSLRSPKITQPPILGQMGQFELINQDGQKFGNDQVIGSVLLVNFIFTRCPDVCPVLTKSMSEVQNRLKGTAKSIQLLSITVDPEFDKPQVLKEYGAKFGARPETWNFLTGTPEQIRKLVVDNFKSALETEPSQDPSDLSPAMEVAHGEHFILVDQLGRIRAYEKIQSTDDISRIVKQFAILVNTPPKT